MMNLQITINVHEYTSSHVVEQVIDIMSILTSEVIRCESSASFIK